MIQYFFVSVPLTEEPLNDHMLLTIYGYSKQRTSRHDLHESIDTFSSPTFVRMLEGKMFVVGPEGVTIGSGMYELFKKISTFLIYGLCIICIVFIRSSFLLYSFAHKSQRLIDRTLEKFLFIT